MKSKVYKLDVDKLVDIPVDLSKPSDVVKIDVVEKDVYYAKIKYIADKISDITNLATNTTLSVVSNKITEHSKYITTLKFNKLTAEKFTARLKQENLATKGDIADSVW